VSLKARTSGSESIIDLKITKMTWSNVASLVKVCVRVGLPNFVRANKLRDGHLQ